MTDLNHDDASLKACPRIRTAARQILKAAGFLLMLLLAATPAFAQLQTLWSFNFVDGALPGLLVQGTDGNFYGVTQGGGPATISSCYGIDCGTIFRLTPAGVVTTIYYFCSQANCTDGYWPEGPLIQATDGNFYGTTFGGGANNLGTIFKITPRGKLTTLYNFCSLTNCADGSGPGAALLQGTDGNLYGTASESGANGNGTLFKITTKGVFTVLYSFCALANCADGAYPLWGLIQANDGNYYGTTLEGGANSEGGTIYKLTPTDTFTTIYNFCSLIYCSDGASPGPLVENADGNFYGTTYNPLVFFEVTPAGVETPLLAGESSTSGLTRGTDGNFYGTEGTSLLFSFTLPPNLAFTPLYTFCSQENCTDGISPMGVIQGTDGNFYGTTYRGGTFIGDCSEESGNSACGTIFRFSNGLGPFVKPQPLFGKVGAKIVILGYGLTGATAVTFGASPATFNVVSDTEITAAVPSGATTAPVQVTTAANTTLTSLQFWVTPQLKTFSPVKGPVGKIVHVTGVSLSQTTSVAFNGVSAKFSVISDTSLTATVPAGATTGYITITTLGGPVTSKTVFTVN